MHFMRLSKNCIVLILQGKPVAVGGDVEAQHGIILPKISWQKRPASRLARLSGRRGRSVQSSSACRRIIESICGFRDWRETSMLTTRIRSKQLASMSALWMLRVPFICSGMDFGSPIQSGCVCGKCWGLQHRSECHGTRSLQNSART